MNHAFELWCWRRPLRVPWTASRSSQSILKEIDPEYSLEGLMLKLQYFGHITWRADSLEKTLMEKGMTEDEMVGWYHRLSWHEFEQALGGSEGQGSLACCSAWGHKELDMTELLNSNNNESKDHRQVPWAQIRNLIPSTCVHVQLLQSCLTFCNPMDCCLPGSYVHGIIPARILEWVAMPSFRGSFQPRDQTHISCGSFTGRQILYHWATWEAWFFLHT